MEKDLYTILGNKVNRVIPQKAEGEFLLSDFLDHRFNLLSKEQYLRAFSNELKLVLSKSTTHDLIKAFFDLESHHHLAESRVGFNLQDLRFDEFYKNISPVILKSVMDLNLQKGEVSSEQIEQILLETIRITVEDEFNTFLIKDLHQ